MNAQQNKQALANYALTKIGGKIFTFGDGSNSDTVISSIYDQCRRYCKEQCPWSFDIKTIALTVASVPSTNPIFNFNDGIAVAYALAPDFLRPYRISVPYAQVVFENVPNIGYCLLSDTANLSLKYVFDNDDPTTYSAKFYEYLACKIAKEACFKITEAVTYVEKLKIDMESAFLEAAAEDGQIATPEEVDDGYWLWARLSGSGAAVGSPGGTLNVGWNPLGY